MISFDTPTHRFHLRAAAVIVHEGSVLLHRANGDDFWALPGGRVAPGESLAHAVEREMLEELGVKVNVGALALVIENFFSHGGKEHHEVGLYFYATPERRCHLLTERGPYLGREGSRPLTFAWFTPSELSSVQLRPIVLAEVLFKPNANVAHIVHHDAHAL